MAKSISQAQIARDLKLSQQAVSKALRGDKDISEETKNRVLTYAAETGYRSNKLARSLVDGKTYMLGVFFPNFSGRYFSSLVNAIEDIAFDYDYRLLLCRWRIENECDFKDIDILLQYNVDGMVVFPRITQPWTECYYNHLIQNGKKMVFIDHIVQLPGAHSVLSDDIRGGEIATEYLLAKGHRRIAAIIPESKIEGCNYDLRLEGYLKALSESGMEVRKDMVLRCTDSLENYRDNIIELLQKQPGITAFFCYNDGYAMELIDILEKGGYSVPEDISIIGYGDNIKYAEKMKIPITTISQNTRDIAKKAVISLMNQINDKDVPNVIKTDVTLIERGSVKNIR